MELVTLATYIVGALIIYLLYTLLSPSGPGKPLDGRFHNYTMTKKELPVADEPLGLPSGKHISLKAKINGKDIRRSYTPVTTDEVKGEFTLLVKVYPKGNMSKHLGDMDVGGSILMAGPKGTWEYKPNTYKKLGMVAGGSGITPMLQIIRRIMGNSLDRTTVDLIYANVTEPDILMRKELEQLMKENRRKFNVVFTLDKPDDSWWQETGFVTDDMMKKYLPVPDPNCFVLACGPPPMMKAAKANYIKIGYPETNMHIF